MSEVSFFSLAFMSSHRYELTYNYFSNDFEHKQYINSTVFDAFHGTIFLNNVNLWNEQGETNDLL